MGTITIPKKFAGRDDLVAIPKKELEALIERAQGIGERDVLRWSRDAKRLHKAGKLPKLTFLRRV